jgi:hypothetical protein
MLEIDPQLTPQALFRATITWGNIAGPVIKMELATGTGAPVHVAMAQERYRALQLHKGADVGVRATALHALAEAPIGQHPAIPARR